MKILKNKKYFFTFLFFSLLISSSRLIVFDKLMLNWDAQFLITGSYRLFINQKIHLDFASHFGIFTFLPGYLGMIILGPTLFAYNLGISMFGLIFGIFSYNILNNIYEFKIAFFLANLVTVFFVSPEVSSHFRYFSYTTQYTEWAYGILILFYCIFIGIKEFKNKHLIIIAFLSSYLFYIKFTFLFSSLLIVFVFLLIRNDSKQHLVKLLTYNLILIYCISLLFNFKIIDYIEDILQIITESDIATLANFISIFSLWIIENIFSICVTFLIGFIPLRKSELLINNKILLFFSLLVNEYLFYYFSDGPERIRILYLYPIFIYLFDINKNKINNIKNLSFIFFPYFYILFIKFSVVFYFFVLGLFPLQINQKLNAEIDFFYEPYKEAETELIQIINTDSKIMFVGYNDLFSFKYGLTLPKNTPLYWHFNISNFKPEKIFEETDFIVIFNSENDFYLSGVSTVSNQFFETYGSYVKSNYFIYFENEKFTIFQK